MGLKRGADSKAWYELGRVRQGIFPLLYTTLPEALNGMHRGVTGLHEKEIEFSGDTPKGMRIFGRVNDSQSIELCLAENEEGITDKSFTTIVKLDS